MERTKTELTPAQAEEMRLALKEMGWALAHWKKLYESLKPDTAPSIEDADPAQLSLFETPKHKRRMKEGLNKKINQAIKLLRLIPTNTEPAEVCYSGGKDSDVILRLAQMAGIKYRAIYKNTTIDPIGTKKHCIDNGVEIINPKLPFFKIVEQKGLPSRWSRHCCSTLKEYKVLDYQIIGVRREESRKRAKRYQEPTICRNYGKGQHVEQYLPILDWTLADIAEFVERERVSPSHLTTTPRVEKLTLQGGSAVSVALYNHKRNALQNT